MVRSVLSSAGRSIIDSHLRIGDESQFEDSIELQIIGVAAHCRHDDHLPFLTLELLHRAHFDAVQFALAQVFLQLLDLKRKSIRNIKGRLFCRKYKIDNFLGNFIFRGGTEP